MFRKLLMSLALIAAIITAPAQAKALESSPDQNAYDVVYVVDYWVNPDGYHYFICNDGSYGYFWLDTYSGQMYDYHYFPSERQA